MTAWRDARRALFVVPVLAAGLGLAGAAAIWSREASQARQRDMLAANQVATAVDRSAGVDLDGLRGANALVADDEQVTTARLNAFAEGLLKDSAILVVAHAMPVDDADRSAFEARLGTSIQEIADGGTYVPAARRPSYLPVVGAVAASPSIKPVIGLDLLSDPDRRSRRSVRPPSATGPASARRSPSSRGAASATSRRRRCALPTAASSATSAPSSPSTTSSTTRCRRSSGAPKVAIYDHGERIIGSLEGGAAASVSNRRAHPGGPRRRPVGCQPVAGDRRRHRCRARRHRARRHAARGCGARSATHRPSACASSTTAPGPSGWPSSAECSRRAATAPTWSSSSPTTPRASSTPTTPRWRSSRARCCARRRRSGGAVVSDGPSAGAPRHPPATHGGGAGRPPGHGCRRRRLPTRSPGPARRRPRRRHRVRRRGAAAGRDRGHVRRARPRLAASRALSPMPTRSA